jgi:hypothetical protein
MAEKSEPKEIDADLQLLIEVWPKLPDAIRKKILLLGQGQKEIVKLVWGAKGYERTVVDTTEAVRAGGRPPRAAQGS